MQKEIEIMGRVELGNGFAALCRNFAHMNELPHEMVTRMVSIVDVTQPEEREWAEKIIDYWADFLQRLSNEVREAGQGALQKSLALHRSEISETDNQGTDGR